MKKPELFDIHSHLNFPDFEEDIEEVVKRMRSKKMWTIAVGTGFKTSKEALELARKYDEIFATVGLHPTDTEEIFIPDSYRELAQDPNVVGIGECGLEFFRIGDNRDLVIKRQKDVFTKQIELAIDIGKPLVIHARDSHDGILEILDHYYSDKKNKLNGNIHFFTGTWEQAQKYFDLGFCASFASVVTFVRDYDDIIKNAPLDKIMAETDSPFVAPASHRGKRNEPSYLDEGIKKIAEIRKESYEKIAEATTKNALKLFGFEK